MSIHQSNASDGDPSELPSASSVSQQPSQERLEMHIAEIGLSVRTVNCLEEKGIFTLNDLLHTTRADLLSISNFGVNCLNEVYGGLQNFGFFQTGRGPDGKSGYFPGHTASKDL